jgi:phosphoribosylglycinamide formyltransferase-1
VRITGCTVHQVTLDVDGGPILDQEAVRVEEGDTLESLTERVHAAEHRLLPRVIAGLSQSSAPRGN